MGFKEYMDKYHKNWFLIMNEAEILVYEKLHCTITSYEAHFRKVASEHTVSDFEISKMGVEISHYKELFNAGIESIINSNESINASNKALI